MIVLDTYIFVFWVNASPRMQPQTLQTIQAEPSDILIRAISLWEIAKLEQLGRLTLNLPIKAWLEQALAYPKVKVVPLAPEIIVDSTRLPKPFHKDPADEIIVATARVLRAPLLTYDAKIRSYPRVTLV